MKRTLILAALVLVAVSCGGRRHKNADGTQEDSLAVAEAAAPDAPKKEAADTVVDLRKMSGLPKEPVFDIVTSMGTIRVKLYKDTPKHRENFIRLAMTHGYDGTLFHRAVDGFIIQGGDPYTRDTSRVEEWGEGGQEYTIDAEILPQHTHKKGALVAARRSNFANPHKESNGHQFFLVQNADNCKHLDGEYTVFGETVGGLNVIDRIAKVQTDRYDHPIRPVRIIRVRPNDQMNKRALEDELKAEEMPILPEEPEKEKADTTKAKKEQKADKKKRDGEVIRLEVQTEVDSSVISGRKLKHRD